MALPEIDFNLHHGLILSSLGVESVEGGGKTPRRETIFKSEMGRLGDGAELLES